ncbi:CAP domain-containing protein [Cellulomonas sp. NPDC089187]|uniref:CAP domain-containing protein n=1 Tax=Cellulomonas sp. NPDC089187 TaxID=3154970 RepID=UPI00341D73B7
MKRIAAGTTIALATLALATAVPATAGTTAAPVTPTATVAPAAVIDQDTAEATILQRTNALRATESKPALVRNSAMDAVAAAWATHMATTGQFAHNPNYATQIPAGWRSAGENIAWNSYDPVALYTQWENSPGHRANMVNSSFTDIGIGVVQYNGRFYGVQVFAGYPRTAS